MKLRITKISFILFVIGIIIFAIFYISKKNDSKKNQTEVQSVAIKYQENLRLGISNYDSINPLVTNNKDILKIDELIFEPLFTLDVNYELQPCLATEFAKKDAITYIVKINNQIKWSDGTMLTAKDVKFTIDRIKEKNSNYSENLVNVTSLEVIDDTTIKIILDQEVPFFEYNLTFPILSNNYYQNEDFYITNKVPIGTGMYKITSLTSSEIMLERNENWNNSQNLEFRTSKITINIYSEKGEIYNSFKIGNIDFIETAINNYEDYIGTIGFYTKEYKGREYDFLSLNCEDSILQDINVRKAISYAIDKDNIISTVFNNEYYKSEYPLDYGNFLYTTQSASSGYNPDQARDVLSDNGWVYSNNKWKKDGKILAFTLIVSSNNDSRCQVAELIKNQLANIGINVNIKKVSDSQYMQYISNKNYQLLLTGVYNSYSPDLAYFYGNDNIANYYNEDVVNILNDLKNITDRNLLLEKYKELIEKTKNDVPYVSLYRNKNTVLINRNAGGTVTPNNYNIFYNIYNWYRE